jgi:flagellar hook-associated protein 2
VSQYASDFQGVLTRAISIAQLPITQLQSQDTTVLSQQALLGSLTSAASALQTSLTTLGTDATSQTLTASSSNSSAATATVSSAAATAGSYTINSITTIATAASEQSKGTGYASSTATPVSNGTMTLEVGGAATTFSLAGNNLNSLVGGINALNAGVTASVVTTGGVSTLAITSLAGTPPIKLYDGTSTTGTDLLTSTGSGTETSTATYADPATTNVSNGTLTLVSAGHDYTFSLSGNNLTSLSAQINTLGAGVTASILTAPTGNYLSLQATATGTTTGGTTLALYDGTSASGTDLVTNTNQGTNAVFSLNGIPITQSSNTVNSVAAGVTFTLLGGSTTPTTITLATNPSQLSTDLQGFVTNYNALMTQISAQVGTNPGPLGGDPLIEELQQTLRQISGYTTPGGAVNNLSTLGVEFADTTGVATFNATTFNALSPAQISGAFTFLGSATTGLGGFSQNLGGYTDSVSGMIPLESKGLSTQDQDIQAHIATLTAQLQTMQTNLLATLEAADATQSELQSQQQQLTGTLQGLSLVLYGQNPVQA